MVKRKMEGCKECRGYRQHRGGGMKQQSTDERMEKGGMEGEMENERSRGREGLMGGRK